MEKRTILAFILSFLVFIIWAHFFVPKSETPVNNNKVIEENRSNPSDMASDQPPVQEINTLDKIAETETALSVDEKQIKVETPLYIATFSNRGPSITGFELKKYKNTLDPASPLVQLFTAQEYIKSHIAVRFNSPSQKENIDLIYSTEGESFTLSQGQPNRELSFKYVTPDGLIIEQVFIFSSAHYDIDLKIKVMNQSENPVNGNIKAVINNLRPDKKARYYTFIGTAVLLDNELNDLDLGDLEENPELSGNINWIAYENEYFMSAVIPEEKKGAKFSGTLQKSGVVTATHISAPFELLPSTGITKGYTLFLGPRDIKILNQSGQGLASAIDFGFFDVIAKPLHYVLIFFTRYVKNFGISIILLTIIIKILFWPLTHKSQKSMKEMQKLQPLMAKIREKYKDNKEMMNKELMGLYRTYKVNPMSGCLPMLIQIPVFIALYSVLSSSIELRHEPFALWIKDLSAPDRLFSFPFSIPFMDPPYGIPILTLLMGASMFIQQKMQPMIGDPAQAKIMMFMPVMFTVMFINFPSGLVLYWLTQNILSIGQQYRINKKPDLK